MDRTSAKWGEFGEKENPSFPVGWNAATQEIGMENPKRQKQKQNKTNNKSTT